MRRDFLLSFVYLRTGVIFFGWMPVILVISSYLYAPSFIMASKNATLNIDGFVTVELFILVLLLSEKSEKCE